MIELLDVMDIKTILKDRRLLAIADSTGLAYMTLRNIQTGKTKYPTMDTVKILTRYFYKELNILISKKNGK